MSLASLDNPLERLAVLPNAMNWRGGWLATEQYYKNDVVVSPSNSASYILANKIALLDGGDPTLNPDWIELSLPTTGVQSVSAGLGMALDPLGTATNPILDNDGVRTFTTGVGLSEDPLSTANDKIVNNDGILSLTQGLGMTITAGQNPTITNDGVRSITNGTGIVVNTTAPFSANTPQLVNTGIITLQAGSGISITPATNPAVISCTRVNPTLSYLPVLQDNAIAGPIPLATTPPNDAVIYRTQAVVGSEFLNSVLDPTYTGGWLLDLSAFNFYVDQQNLTTPCIISVSLNGLRPGPGPNPPWTYPVPAADGGQILLAGATAAPPQNFVANGGQVYLDLAAYRAVSNNLPSFAGSGPANISFTNQTGLPLYYTSFPRTILMTYYPGGLQ